MRPFLAAFVVLFLGTIAALAHPVVEFERAVPAVGSVVSGRITQIVLYFRTEYDSRDVSILVDNGKKNIPFHIVPMEHTMVIVAETEKVLEPGVYYVSWRITEHHHSIDFPHLYKFTVK